MVVSVDKKIDFSRKENNKSNINDFEDESIFIYFREVSKYSLLTFEEEKELSKKIEKGDNSALEKLINSNLRLVVKVAKQFVCKEYPLIDIIQDGNMGLITAAKKYDYSKNVRFSTYALWWIMQTIKRNLNIRKRLIKLPHNKEEKLKAIKSYLENFYKKFNRYPAIGEISDQIKISREEIEKILIISQNMSSIDEYFDEDFQIKSLKDEKFIPEKITIKNNLNEIIDNILTSLTEREKEILINRFGLNGESKKSLKDIAIKLGTSQENIRRIEVNVLKKLKNDFAHIIDFLN